MNYYFAPLEGVTGYIYRNAHHTYFNGIDKYFAPFIVAKQRETFKSKEINDLLPENNEGLVLIPQILTNNFEDFIYTSKMIRSMGYQEINLNLGCPSGTVVAKHRGSGFLAKREELDVFLEEIFTADLTKISIKTRIGKDDSEEFYELIEIFNKYPITELIIHPRIQKDYYSNKPNLSVYQDAIRLSKNPLCYNGDLFNANDYRRFLAKFPDTTTVMMGRGLITNPGLIGEIEHTTKPDKELLKSFHDKIYEDYQGILSGDRNVLFKMKEIWFYMISMFTEHGKYAKRIKKAERLKDYEEAVSSLFREQNLIEN